MTTSNTPNVPDGIAFNELQKLIKSAPKGEPEVVLYGNKTKEQMLDAVEKNAQALLDECPDPMAHKGAIVCVLTSLVDWHLTSADKAALDGRLSEAGAWTADAGALNAALNIIRAVDCGRDKDLDFFIRENPFSDETDED